MDIDDELNELFRQYDEDDDNFDNAKHYEYTQKFVNPYLFNRYKYYFNHSLKRTHNVNFSHAMATTKLIQENNVNLSNLLKELLHIRLLAE